MSKVKILRNTLVIVLIALITFGVGITLALNSNEVKIEISEVPNIDVVLSKAKTNVNLSTFEKDLKDRLEEEGMDLSKVKISAIETSTISSSDMNASEIFNSWQQYPALDAPMFNADWKLEGDCIRTTVDTHWTGFWNKSAQNDSDYTIEFDMKSDKGDSSDPLGFTFRMNENSTNEYQFYGLEFSRRHNTMTLAKINSWIPSENDYKYAGPILHTKVNQAFHKNNATGFAPENGISEWDLETIKLIQMVEI